MSKKPNPFPWKEESGWPPDYVAIYGWRQRQLLTIRANKTGLMLYGAREFYRNDPASFILHWVDTYDPRLAGTDLPARLPFVLFKRQREFVEFLRACVSGEADGLVEKCRDVGATWCAVAFSVWAWLFLPGASIGWGSRKEQLVDRIGDADSIFEKMRIVIAGLPREFLPTGFVASEHATYMRIVNPENGATITGESGDNIGRGGRKLAYFKDESAHYEHAEKIEAALTDNTRVQVDISSVNGIGTVFDRRREAGAEWAAGSGVVKGRTNVFVFDWRDHPAKTQAWYDQRREKAINDGLLHVFAQEVDRDARASLEGVIIPALWVRAAIDAHKVLGFDDSGGWAAALDVADEGGDLNAFAARKGVVLKVCHDWGARDTGQTARIAVDECASLGTIDLQYDCVGVGAGVKAETNRLREEKLLPRGLRLVPWNGGAAVRDPDGRVIPGDHESPLNADFYHNLKAQAWWQLRRRFELTWRAVSGKLFGWNADDLISLSSDIPQLRKLEKELSQPTASKSVSKLKLIVDKKPDGARSPNLADGVVMCYWPAEAPRMVITDQVLARAAQPVRRRA